MSRSPITLCYGPRFSLLTILLLTTIVAMGIAIWKLGSEVVPLREEVHALRDELGIFQIDEPDKIYAIRVETEDDDLHKFRVYLPEGRPCRINYAYAGIPDEGFPSNPGGSFSIEPGGYLISVRLKTSFDPDTGGTAQHGTIKLAIEPTDGQRMSSSKASIAVGGDWIVDKETRMVSRSIKSIGRKVELFPADKAVNLIRFLAAPLEVVERGPDGEMIRQTYENQEQPGKGFMLWIDKVPPKEPLEQ